MRKISLFEEDVFLKNFRIIHMHFISLKLVLYCVFAKNFKFFFFKYSDFHLFRSIEVVSQPNENEQFLGQNSLPFLIPIQFLSIS